MNGPTVYYHDSPEEFGDELAIFEETEYIAELEAYSQIAEEVASEDYYD